MYTETTESARRRRYGLKDSDPLPTWLDLEKAGVEFFLRHRSIRDFSTKPVEESRIQCLIAAAQSAATSSNLQLWSLISIQDEDRRKELGVLCGDQKQIYRAPWFFAFLADHYRLREASRAVGIEPDGLDYTEFFIMSVIDASLAAERMVCAAETMGLGICYIGALRNNVDRIKELLKLPKGVFGVFGLCIGWPSGECAAKIKPRLPQNIVLHRETYQRKIDVSAYDECMVEFYASEKMNPSYNWSMRSGKRADGHHLEGRERLKTWLEEQGFNLR